jgi:hypothetical protein
VTDVVRRILVFAALFTAGVLPTAPLRAADKTDGEPTWEPGNSTTSRVKDEVDADDRGRSADGVYGRFEGDLDIGFGAGVDATTEATLGAVRGSLHYFSTIGVYLGYADALGSANESDRRRLSLGVDLRPAFIPRWSKNIEQGPSFVDLTLDSISLGVGVWWADPPGGSFGDRRGLEASLGLGVPLMGNATGLWLEARGLLRWADPAHDPGDKADGGILALLSWHQLVQSPLSH